MLVVRNRTSVTHDLDSPHMLDLRSGYDGFAG